MTQYLDLSLIHIPPNRQRREFDAGAHHNSSATLAPGSLYVAAQKSHDSLNAAIDRLAAAPKEPT